MPTIETIATPAPSVVESMNSSSLTLKNKHTNTFIILINSVLPGKWFVYGKFWMSGCIVNVKFVGWIENESQKIQHGKPLIVQLENTQFNESLAISQNALVNIQPPRGHSLVRHNTCKRHQQTFSVESHTWFTPSNQM